jgi:hypothetical protein
LEKLDHRGSQVSRESQGARAYRAHKESRACQDNKAYRALKELRESLVHKESPDSQDGSYSTSLWTEMS